jgi:hypothetical protein
MLKVLGKLTLQAAYFAEIGRLSFGSALSFPLFIYVVGDLTGYCLPFFINLSTKLQYNAVVYCHISPVCLTFCHIALFS